MVLLLCFICCACYIKKRIAIKESDIKTEEVLHQELKPDSIDVSDLHQTDLVKSSKMLERKAK